MKNQRKGLVRFLLILILAFVLIRISPILARMVHGILPGIFSAIGAASAVFIVMAIFWRRLRRKTVTKRSSQHFDPERLRDVTESASGK